MFLLLLSLLLVSYDDLLICMDTPTNTPMITIKLDDTSIYSIAKWKVKKESNTLCECYYSQHTYFEHAYGKHKNNPIIVHNISREELRLFDHALDKLIDSQQPDSFSEYFKNLSRNQQRLLTIAAGQQLTDGTKKLCAQRLTYQLVGCYFDQQLVSKKIIIENCSELVPLVMYLKTSIISDNLQNNLIVPSPISSYSINPEEHLKKWSKNGSLIFVPKVTGLNADFNGQPSKWSIMDEAKEKYAVRLCSPKKKYFITNTKFINNTVDISKLLIWQEDPQKIIKTVNHNAHISRASFSADGKWLITCSSAMHGGQLQGKLVLTCLDDSLDDHYLSDTLIVPAWNLNLAPYFNNASTFLASGKRGQVELFSLQTKKIFSTLCIPGRSKPWPLELSFNDNDTRLVGCFDHGVGENKHTIMIWDISDLDNIKELQSIEVATRHSSDATITFNYPEQNTIVVSTEYTTFFFNADSGAFLGKTPSEEGKENYMYAAACSIMYSPITCIGTNNGNTSSCARLYNHLSGNCIGTIPFTEPLINGMGITSNGRFLVTTFDGYKTITTELIKQEQSDAMVKLVNTMKLVDFYALLQLYKAKKQNRKNHVSQPLFEYIHNAFAANSIAQSVIEKCLCS